LWLVDFLRAARGPSVRGDFPFPSTRAIFASLGGVPCQSIKSFSSAVWAAIRKRATPAAAKPSQNFSVATDESYKDKNGERQKRTEWHKIVVWGKQAEIAQQYLKKGSLIFIEGRIQSANGRTRKAKAHQLLKS